MFRIAVAAALAISSAAASEGGSWHVARQMCGDSGGEAETFRAGECQQAISNPMFSVMYTCADDGAMTEQFFMNSDCSGTPQTHAMEAGVCKETALGVQLKYKCYLATALDSSTAAKSL
mmetsp:Transcript_113177/g.225364  ORF Transcript_113177/g.225364 Transcript_113177/m.225364 type:complete len:119 (-) Transcript_113177:315-671(-)